MSASDPRISIEDRSVKNNGNMGPVNTGNVHYAPRSQKEPRVFSSFILPAVIVAVGTVAAALIAIYVKR